MRDGNKTTLKILMSKEKKNISQSDFWLLGFFFLVVSFFFACFQSNRITFNKTKKKKKKSLNSIDPNQMIFFLSDIFC